MSSPHRQILSRLFEWGLFLCVGLVLREWFDGNAGLWNKVDGTPVPQFRLPQDGNSHSPSKQQQGGLEFVIILGLEGVGHHFMQTIVEKSPDWMLSRQLGITNTTLQQLHGALFRYPQQTGLWNMPCREVLSKKVKDTPTNATNLDNSQTIDAQLVLPHESDSVAKQEEVMKLLIAMQKRYDEHITIADPRNQVGQDRPTIRVPVNTAAPSGGYGMLSYPNFAGPCRTLQYPSIELLYDACDRAGVRCSHLYLYRNPLNVLVSTSLKRHFNPPGLVKATHLYTSHLKILETQMRGHPYRTLGCLGLYEEDDTIISEWKETLREIWGWKNDTSHKASFNNLMQKLYKKPEPREENSTQVKYYLEHHLPYFDLFVKAHNQTLSVCREFTKMRNEQDGK